MFAGGFGGVPTSAAAFEKAAAEGVYGVRGLSAR